METKHREKTHKQMRETPYIRIFPVFVILWHERQGWRELYRGVHLNGLRSLVGWGITNSVYEFLHRWMTGITER